MTKLQKALREAEEVRTRLSACLESLPDPGTINTPNERVRVETLLVNLRAFDGRVMSAAHTCANPKTAWDLKPLRAWRDTLISARQNFKTNIEELAGIRRWRAARRRSIGSAVCAPGDRRWPERRR